MPWNDSPGHIASDRLRRLIEREAPGHAEFLPVGLVWRNKPANLGNYWMINWLHMVDCFDRARSKYTTVPDKHEPEGQRLSFDKLVINSRKIPRAIAVCRLTYYENIVVIRRSLREVLDAHGITGCQFYAIDQV